MSARPHGNATWTDEAVASLRELYPSGLTLSQISREILKRHGVAVSRCAVIGKANRLKMYRSAQASQPKRAEIKAPPVKRAQYQNASLNFKAPKGFSKPPKPVRLARMTWGNPESPKPVAPTPIASRVDAAGKKTLVELLRSDCRFGVGDAQSDDFRFCAEAVKPGSVYCREHHARCYCAPRPRAPATTAIPVRGSAA